MESQTYKIKKQAIKDFVKIYKVFEQIEKSPVFFGTGKTRLVDKMVHDFIWNNGGEYKELYDLEKQYEEMKSNGYK